MSTITEKPPVVVEARGISKRFIIHKDKSLKERLTNPRRSRGHREDFWALQDINLDIHSGETIGLIGPNGSGKSTLLKTIGGIIEPTSGTVRTRGRMAALLELGAGFHPDLTGRENIFLNAAILGISKKETERRFHDIVEFSGIPEFIDTQVKFYSSGMYVRLAFAVAINIDPDVLLVDEVLAVGDENFQKKCLDKIRQFQEEGRTIILVSHALGEIEKFCTRAVVLGNGSVVFDGPAKDAVSVLRAGYKTRAEAEANRAQLERQREREAAAARIRELGRITDVRTRIISSNAAGSLVPGGTVEVDIDVDFAEKLENWVVGISVTNALETSLMSTSTTIAGLPVTDPRDQATVRFVLPELSLGSGEYFITAALFTSDNQQIHRVDGRAKFAAEAFNNSVGSIYTNATVSLVN